MQNYIMCIIFSVGQVLALLYYLASYVPGGTQSVQWVLRMVGKGCFSCFRSASGALLPT